MGEKFKTLKNPWGFKQNHKKIPGSEINPPKIRCSISEPQNFPKSINWYNKNSCHLKSRGPSPPPPLPPSPATKINGEINTKRFCYLKFHGKKTPDQQSVKFPLSRNQFILYGHGLFTCKFRFHMNDATHDEINWTVNKCFSCKFFLKKQTSRGW